MYLIGKVIKTHGVKGELKINNYSDFKRFVLKKEVIINQNTYVIKSVRSQNELLLVMFEGINDLNEAQKLRGFEIYASDSIKQELASDEYHLPQLINLLVYTSDNQLVGTVKYVNEVPQGHMLEVIKTDGKKILIPFLAVFVKEVLTDRIIIDPIEGLI